MRVCWRAGAFGKGKAGVGAVRKGLVRLRCREKREKERKSAIEFVRSRRPGVTSEESLEGSDCVDLRKLLQMRAYWDEAGRLCPDALTAHFDRPCTPMDESSPQGGGVTRLRLARPPRQSAAASYLFFPLRRLLYSSFPAKNP